MSTTAGRSWVYRLLEATHIYQTSRRSTPHDTYFAEGERNVGLRLLTDLMSYCPELYLQMLQDANVKEAANDRRYGDDRSTTAAARSDGDAGGPVSEYDPSTSEDSASVSTKKPDTTLGAETADGAKPEATKPDDAAASPKVHRKPTPTSPPRKATKSTKRRLRRCSRCSGPEPYAGLRTETPHRVLEDGAESR